MTGPSPAILIAVLSLSGDPAGHPAALSRSATAADDVAQIEQEFRKALQSGGPEGPGVETLQALADRAVVLADEATRAETEYLALEWALRISQFRFAPDYRQDPELKEVYQEVLHRLIDDFVDHAPFGRIVLSLEESETEALERIAEEATAPAVRACLDWREVSQLSAVHRFSPLGKEELARLRELLARFEQEDYATLEDPLGRGTFGELAGRCRFELEHLSIGSIAPDIVGEDLDGVEFQLSDYRGKVVLLDFWGHW